LPLSRKAPFSSASNGRIAVNRDLPQRIKSHPKADERGLRAVGNNQFSFSPRLSPRYSRRSREGSASYKSYGLNAKKRSRDDARNDILGIYSEKWIGNSNGMTKRPYGTGKIITLVLTIRLIHARVAGKVIAKRYEKRKD
jgi:hypothetical protein